MTCPFCQSLFLQKRGIRKNKQKYWCKACKKWFSSEIQEVEITKDIEPGGVFQYKTNKSSIKVHCVTDIHHGANEHHWDKFDDFIDMVKKDDNCVWFMNGDNIELIPPKYKISQRGQYQEPDEQHFTFLERVKPIRDKCLFVRGGNHDYIRSENILGFDVSKALARGLNVPYYKMPGYSEIQVKNKKWYLVSGHGKGGGKNGDLELDKMASVYTDGDVFILGHNHQLYTKPIDSLVVEEGEERLRRRWYCRGGSFLKYAEYARYSFFPMIRTGWVTIEFNENNIKCWTN